MSISSVTSEALQLKLRQLLPSQQGFGTDLSASDTIIPIIDLTASAEGSDVREDLQKALAYGSQTHVTINNTTSTIISETGFYKIIGVSSLRQQSSGVINTTLTLTDGVTPKTIYQYLSYGGSSATTQLNNFELLVFLASGESVTGTTNSTEANLSVSVRQVADINGTLVQPVGFTPQ